MDRVKDFSVLVVGDSIIDEYRYVTPLGKSPKEHLISTRYEKNEIFLGGVWAAAKHVEGICGRVNVSHGKTTTRKIRYIDGTYLRKLFEVHREEENGVGKEYDYRSFDLVIVTDFGHGFITRAMIEDFSKAKFLAVNAQTNSANFGFNLITKYPRADFVVIDEPEARLAAQDRYISIEAMMRLLCRDRFDRMIVTHGRNGAYGLDESGFYHQPALTDRVVDTMGAGDAFFAITAPLAAVNAPMEYLLKVGNAAGALKTQIVGHRSSITREGLQNFLAERG